MAPFSPLPPSRVPTSPSSRTTYHPRPYSHLFGRTLPPRRPKRISLNHLIEHYTWAIGLALVSLAMIAWIAFFPADDKSTAVEFASLLPYDDVAQRPVILHDTGSNRERQRRGPKRMEHDRVVYVREEDLPALLPATSLSATHAPSPPTVLNPGPSPSTTTISSVAVAPSTTMTTVAPTTTTTTNTAVPGPMQAHESFRRATGDIQARRRSGP